MMSGVTNPHEDDQTLSELIETNFLKCLLCKTHYQDPRLLPCLHTFCKKCIEKIQTVAENQSENSNLIQNGLQENSHSENSSVNGSNDKEELNTKLDTKSKKQPEASLVCPVCKSNITTQSNGICAFPVNTFMKDLCEMHDYKHEKERKCEYCKFDGKVTSATSLCLDCQDNMCQGCTAAHKRTKVTRGHKVIPYAQAQKGLYDVDIRDYQKQKCSQHEGEQLSMFCEKCEVMMCKECKVITHDNHKWTNSDKAVGKYDIQMRNLLGGIQKQIPSIHNYLQFLNNYDKSVEGNRDKIIAATEKQSEALHRMIEDQKAAFIEAMNESCDKERCEIQVKSSNLKTAANSLQNNEQYLRFLLQHGKPDEILVLHREITKRLTQLMHLQLDGVTTKLRMDFVPGNSTSRNIQTVFGKLSIDNVPLSQLKDGLGSCNALQISTILPNVRNTAELVMEFDAEGKTDGKEVWPTGLAITKYDDLIVVDRDNKRVKIYNNQGKLQREITGKGDNKFGSPFDVTALKSGDFAVTDHESEDVKVFTTTGDHVLTIKDDIKYPRGITVNSKGEIIILDCQLRHLTIHDPKTGIKIRTIDATDAKGSKVLVDPYYVTVNAQDNIIVTDTAAPNIKVFSETGKYLANYGHYGLSRQDEVLQPYGVCCDEYGYIFVADNQNHRIHLLLPDGKFSKFLVTKADSLWHPMGLALTQKGYLIVTEALGKVKLYKYI